MDVSDKLLIFAMSSLSTPGSCHWFICNPLLMTRHGNRERGHYSKRSLPKHKTTESHCSLRSTVPSTLGPRISGLTSIVGQPLTLNELATTGRIVDRVEVKLDLTTDQ
jgi:hypothetical protein